MSEVRSFLDLPYDLRVFLIDEMQPADRCRFVRCSKICNREAKASKNYIYGLELNCIMNVVTINILHGKYQNYKDRDDGYSLKFESQSIRYSNLNNVELWNIELDDSIDHIEYGIEYFKNLLQCYQDTVKRLEIGDFFLDFDLRNYDFGITSLRNLEKLKVCGNINFLQFFSKSRKPLKELEVYRINDCEELANCEEIYECQNALTIVNTTLNAVQLSKLSAKNVTMLIEELTAEDILNFIRSWQNGTSGKDIDTYRFCLGYTKSILTELSCLLDVNLMLEGFKIKHKKDAGKSAELRYTLGMVQFKTSSQFFRAA